MKKLLLSITLLASFVGSAQILSQDFEEATFPPTDWTTETLVPSRPWSSTTTLTPAGQDTFLINGGSSAFINWIAQDNDATLTSPAFSLVGYSSASFQFKVKVGWSYMIDLASGNLFAQISTDGSNWVQLWVEEDQGFEDDGDGDPDTDLYDTQTATLDISAFVGNPSVQIRFNYVGNDADAVSVDDVLVTGVLANDEFTSSKFSVSPNPAQSVITISNSQGIALTNVSITDINGRVIKNVAVSNVSETQLNISDLNSGVYFMNINSESGKAVKKFVKN